MNVSFLILLLSMSSAGPTAATPQDSGSVGEPNPDKAEYIDEIEVLGRMSTIQLGNLVVKARLQFWDLYNGLNNVDEFRVVCEKRAATGTKIKKLSCEPMYYREKAAELTWQRSLSTAHSRGTARGIGAQTPNQRNFVRMTKDKKKEADAHMITLIENNPLLRAKYEFLVEANEAYERSKRPE